MDGTGALMKHKIQIEQMKLDGEKLQNAKEIMEFLKNMAQRIHAGPQEAQSSTNKYSCVWSRECALG